MITLSACLDDVADEVSLNRDTAAIGGSTVERFASVHLSISTTAGRRWRSVWVGEEADPALHAVTVEAAEQATRAVLDFEGVKLCLSDDPVPAITVARTIGGTTPLFVATAGRCLVASWKFEVAAGALQSRVPNVDACRLFLEHSQCRTREQILAGVQMLWPGESLRFDSNGLTFRPIAVPHVVLPSALRDDARATDTFVNLISAAVRRPLARAGGAALEVSGGLDSSCVAVAASRVTSGLRSYGAIQPGVVGSQQRRRRQELIKLLGLKDRATPPIKGSPTQWLEDPECQITPFDDLYRTPCLAALDLHGSGTIDTVLSGIGGDELTKEYSPGRPDWELAGIPSSSGSVAAASRADMFMRRGIWPVNPLVSVPVVNFCRALPLRLRSGRLLNVLSLARAGLSDGFLFPRYHEHFGNVLTQEGMQTDYDVVFRQSVIADYGITDISAVLQEARAATLEGISWRLISKLYNMAKLEYVLRRYLV